MFDISLIRNDLSTRRVLSMKPAGGAGMAIPEIDNQVMAARGRSRTRRKYIS
jgi:hypothetical protein